MAFRALVAGAGVPRLACGYPIQSITIGGMPVQGVSGPVLAGSLSPTVSFGFLAWALFAYGLGTGTGPLLQPVLDASISGHTDAVRISLGVGR